MTLTISDLNAIKAALQPEFTKSEERIKAALQPEFKKLEKKFDHLRRDNKKDHNLILKYLDQRDSRLEKRLVRVENHVNLPTVL